MRKIEIKVIGPWLLHGETVCVAGNCRELGDWDPEKALEMRVSQGIVWAAEFDCDEANPGLEYKFIKKSADGTVVWETCFNRTATGFVGETTFPDQRPRYAGTAVPVFSLRTKESTGIGDFADVRALVDWAVASGQAIIQLLPVNDTTSSKTWTDSYPYAGISIMALHPVYLRLKEAGTIKDAELRKTFRTEGKALEALSRIDYELVYEYKMRYCRALYAQDGASTLESPSFKAFVEKNRSWLLPYAAFCLLRDKYHTADFSKWKTYSVYDEAKVEKLFKARGTSEEMNFHIFLQYHLDRQMRRTHEYAKSRGVAIKGDIPIGITPHSVEAWAEPEYFNMGEQAGAPPDVFSLDGQNWGFPTYNWDRMAEDGYAWWLRRFRKMAEYFDAYRIDHVLGFFRIWEIPHPHKSGLLGHFSPALPFSPEELKEKGFPFDAERHSQPCEGDDPKEVLFLEDPVRRGLYHPRINAQSGKAYSILSQREKETFNRIYEDFFYHRNVDFWREQAMLKLPVLTSATNMLTCAEDLGMIPSCVPQVLSDLHVLTLEVQRMPKDPACQLGDPHSYPYLCVCTTGSHDTSTLRGWWGEIHSGEDCPVDTCRSIVWDHLASGAMLAIFPLQDWFSLNEAYRVPDTAEERINVPANPKNYWRYRMHVTLDQMIADEDFNRYLSETISASGRTK